ncbi:hypothetical protein [Sphingomonas mollis]|uniref:Uncharacterized protein n=1 Tax=Sphingomonas mollis TaxID=2795726 RepID=A0ABS0XS79_9SPHN|nr:hypothetical protein [Sphingomonas sp. BT553]MBJ6122891.1 hypothetical protein [Sphingomonas sp. BT553]
MIVRPKRLIALTILTWLHAPALAQQTSGRNLGDELATCRGMRDDVTRLACYDRAAGNLVDAQRSGDLVVLDRKAVVERRKRSFGLPASSQMAAADVKNAEVKELAGVVRGTSPTRTPGRYIVTLADGSRWETLDPVSPPQSGETINITATRLGGFRAKIGGRRAFLVKRLR